MTKKTFAVGGLHCEGCVKSVQAILVAQPGVASAKVDLASGRADIEVTQAFDAQAAVQAVTKAGFAMTPA
jgi:P-type Cu+ transporter